MSKGVVKSVQKRMNAAGMRKITMEYVGLHGHKVGDKFPGHIPPHANVRIFRINWASENSTEDSTKSRSTKRASYHTETDLDLEPMPTMRSVGPDFTTCVVAIYRDIVREYAESTYPHRNRIWNKVLSAMKYSLATIRKVSTKRRRRRPIGELQPQGNDPKDQSAINDKRAIKKAVSQLHAVIKSTSGVRQGSALSSLYFCALLQDALVEVAKLFPDVKIRAYMDDVTMSSKNQSCLEAAFLHLRELSADLALKINFTKSEWFNKEIDNATNELPSTLRSLGVAQREDVIKILGAYIGEHNKVSDRLVGKLEKHKCLFRRLRKMGPSNISLAMLQRSALPRNDYHLRVHRPADSLLIAQHFDKEIDSIVSHWFFADTSSTQLASLPQHLGGLGLTPSVLKHRYSFDTASKSIDEEMKTTKAPVDLRKSKTSKFGDSGIIKPSPKQQAARTQAMKALKQEQKKLATELRKDLRLDSILKLTTSSFRHLQSTSGYVNPYLFRYAIMMRLGIKPPTLTDKLDCPGCAAEISSYDIFQHIVGCTKCNGMNATRKHSYLVRFLASLCSKAGVPCVVEPRSHASFYCMKYKAHISEGAIDKHPCRARRIRSGPDLGIMWPHMGEVLYDLTVVHTGSPSYRKMTEAQLLQNAIERKQKKYVLSGGVDEDYFRCLPMTESGYLHENTRKLLTSLAKKANLDICEVTEAFQLEIEKLNAYTIVTQLRDSLPKAVWLGSIKAQ